MNKKFFLGLFIGIAVSILVGILLYYTEINWNRQITFGECMTIITGLFIAIYIPIAVGQKIDNKKNMKMYILEEIEQIELYYKSMEDIVQSFYTEAKDISIFKTLIRSRNKHIANKILDIKKNHGDLNKIESLLFKNNEVREYITENFGDTSFKSIDQTYIQLFTKCFDEISLIISEIKREILKN